MSDSVTSRAALPPRGIASSSLNRSGSFTR
jgi:hypothetical protein